MEDEFIDSYWEEQAELAYEGQILGRCDDREEDYEEGGDSFYQDDNFAEEEVVQNALR